jgi:predicted N-acetyltransferase YhbS
MTITTRSYELDADFEGVSDFLYSLYEPYNRDGNCFQPIWEYAYTHPFTDPGLMHNVRIWEDDGAMIGLAFFETELVDTFFCVHSDYPDIKADMMLYAQSHLTGLTRAGDTLSRVYLSEFDQIFLQTAKSMGYVRRPLRDRHMYCFDIPDPFPEIDLPPGFSLTDMEETYDLYKMDRVLWRGFDHPGEPPENGVEDRKRMQSGPHYRKDLAVVVQAPNGDFAAFSGLWYDHVNRFAYVEPVATDPDYRRLGIGKSAVMEGIRRCAQLGATVAYVWSDQEFYKAMGFWKAHSHLCLQRVITSAQVTEERSF